jgi:hypothetical protein
MRHSDVNAEIYGEVEFDTANGKTCVYTSSYLYILCIFEHTLLISGARRGDLNPHDLIRVCGF